ncbi:hypothetical protein QCA50_014419 [Cerrena zonata]|uniref:Uncharacterized protein n=1 Tax=Cerrena zonata TaxID=2478898 RepID=A0AAW0FSU3_9APHY
MAKVYGFVPDYDYLVSRAVEKNLVPTQPTDEEEEVDAIQAALYDIIDEAELGRVVELILVRIGIMPMFAIVLATERNRLWVTKDDIARLKKIIGTGQNPAWYWQYNN